MRKVQGRILNSNKTKKRKREKVRNICREKKEKIKCIRALQSLDVKRPKAQEAISPLRVSILLDV